MTILQAKVLPDAKLMVSKYWRNFINIIYVRKCLVSPKCFNNTY